MVKLTVAAPRASTPFRPTQHVTRHKEESARTNTLGGRRWSHHHGRKTVPFPMLAALGLALHATLAAPALDPARPRLLVSVRVEDRALADAGLVAEVAATARDIWRPYVDVLFGRSGDIRRTIEVDELELVVTHRTLGTGFESGLGWIDFVDGRPSRTITVSTTAAVRLMEASSWRGRPLPMLPAVTRRQFVIRALGRAVAHEMGHYLLQSKVHVRRGLMRERLTAEDIMAVDRVNDRLDADQTRKLWQRVMEFARRGVDGEPSPPAPGLPPS